MSYRIESTKKCPYCGHVYQMRSKSAFWKDDVFVDFGSPLVNCVRCHQTFKDSSTYELAVCNPISSYLPKGYLKPIHAGSILLVLAALGYSILSIHPGTSEISPEGNLLVWGVALVGLGMDLWRYISHKNEVALEQIRSEDRLARNPAYARKLKEAGYNVPERFLKSNK